ncbi:MAG: hypothetical protein PHY08_05215 [Candidatus Cloacimonetes bacterium]|jgi:excinuclease ABC subunit C|nr:hypothetical protein [Candidatus Cloacimonadota bacterium]MDD4155954.1 hypothetical protein [Candidatus Cloacimonadota bacterium]
MKKILKSEIQNNYNNLNIPETTGTFILLKNNQILFIKTTGNLNKFIHFYTDQHHEDNNVKDLINQFEIVYYFETQSLIEAFIIEQIIVNTGKFDKFQASILGNIPEYNIKIKPWYKYLYLAINFIKPPYISISNDTVKDDFYIGPFRNSFSLNDALDTFADIFKLPRCESEDYPCLKLAENKCLGFCQNKLSEALPELINKMLLIPNKQVVEKLKTKQEALINDLQFFQADILTEQIKILQRYYKIILFSYVSQFINGEYELYLNEGLLLCKLIINDGMIKEISIENKNNHKENQYFYICDTDLSNRRNNELLAYEKSEYDHRWIVFNFLYDTEPDVIEAILVENLQYIQQNLFKKINGGIND